VKDFEQPTIKILKRLFNGKDETNIHISYLNLVDYEVIEMITNYKLSETHTSFSANPFAQLIHCDGEPTF
jgi:hypothetical protein